MKNETFRVPPTKPTPELHWLTVIQTIVLFVILAINIFFLFITYQGMQYSARNKKAVDLVIEKLQDKNVITEEEKKDIKEEVKEVSPNGGQEQKAN